MTECIPADVVEAEAPPPPSRDPAAELAALVGWGLANPMAVGELHGLRTALRIGLCDSLEVIAERIRQSVAPTRPEVTNG